MMTKEVLGSEEAMISHRMRQPDKEYIIIFILTLLLHGFISLASCVALITSPEK